MNAFAGATRDGGARGTGGPPPSGGRTPPHPGRFLESRFVRPLGLSQTELAAALGVSRRRVNELINGRRGITADTAVRLAKYFRTDVAFWMQLQLAWDMRNATRKLREARSRPTR